MTTNQPTPVILSDEVMKELETQLAECTTTMFPITATRLRALCQTVRALRDVNQGIVAGIQDGKQLLHDQIATLTTENTALREQLAHLQSKTHFLTCGARIAALESRLAQVEKERSINLCGDVTHCATCAEAKDFKP